MAKKLDLLLRHKTVKSGHTKLSNIVKNRVANYLLCQCKGKGVSWGKVVLKDKVVVGEYMDKVE